MKFVDWGLIPYPEATEKQLHLVEQVASGAEEDTVIFCTHPPVVTLGRSSRPEDITDWSGDVFESSRGGRATYHGPEQLVIYPVLNLKKQRQNLREKDVHQYLRMLEGITVEALKTLGISSQVKETRSLDGEGREIIYTGVWVGDKKIASLGIAVRKWTTYHGVAINLTSSQRAFQGIQPCGFTTDTMTSIQEQLDQDPEPRMLKESLQSLFLTNFI